MDTLNTVALLFALAIVGTLWCSWKLFRASEDVAATLAEADRSDGPEDYEHLYRDEPAEGSGA